MEDYEFGCQVFVDEFEGLLIVINMYPKLEIIQINLTPNLKSSRNIGQDFQIFLILTKGLIQIANLNEVSLYSYTGFK